MILETQEEAKNLDATVFNTCIYAAYRFGNNRGQAAVLIHAVRYHRNEAEEGGTA